MSVGRLCGVQARFGPKLAAWMVVAASTLLLVPGEGVAEGAPPSCRALYVARLQLAREAASNGDQQAVVARLEEAQEILRLCTEDPTSPGGARRDEAPAHVLGRASEGGTDARSAG